MIRFLFAAAALTTGLPLLISFVHKQNLIGAVPSFLYETTWLVAFATAVIFIYLYRARRGVFFVQLYLLSMAVKLIAYFGYNLIMIMDDRAGSVRNVLYFLLVYILFTSMEIGFLYRKISRDPRP